MLVFALAAFAAATAYGSTASPATTHRRAAGERLPHRSSSARARSTHTSSAAPSSRGRAAERRAGERSASQRSRRVTSESRRPSPEEVGRAAGLKIRRDLARRNGYRSTEARSTERPRTYQRVRYREAYRYRRARAVRVAEREPLPTERLEPARPESYEEPGRWADRGADIPAERADVVPDQPMPEHSRPDEARPEQPSADSGTSEASDVQGPARQPADGAAAPSTLPAASGEEETTEDLAPDTTHPDEDTDEASLAIPRGAMPAPLRGSLASLERQNARLDAEGLERIEDESDLAARIADGLLVPVPVSSALTVNAELPPNHRYCRPWTARFLADLARAHEALFHRPLEVSSAVRTVEYQQHLMRVNGNAAPAEGDIVSPHLTGATIDIAKRGLDREEIGWMRRRLLELESEGKIDVEEEFRQACFHITVYKTYDPPRTLRRPSEAKEPQTAPAADAGSSTSGL